MTESLEARFAKLLVELKRLRSLVLDHREYITELGQRVNEHTDALYDIGEILDASCEGLVIEPTQDKLPTIIRLIEHGDNVVSCPKFRGR